MHFNFMNSRNSGPQGYRERFMALSWEARDAVLVDLRTFRRADIDEIALELGLDPEEHRNKRGLVRAIEESLEPLEVVEGMQAD